jgi:hypothetical protein
MDAGRLAKTGELNMAQTAIGAAKIRAAHLGMALADFQRRNIAEKWCTGCKAWHSRSIFGADASRPDGLASSCQPSRSESVRRRRIPRPRRSQAGVYKVSARDGDKKQARRRVNHAVDTGRLADPNTLPCADCGHAYDGKTRHEYDHHLGYSAEYQMSVEAVCSSCHHAREAKRRQ